MKYKYIAIEREYASGGREIAKSLGQKMEIPCYGDEILHMLSQESGIALEKLQKYDESANNSMLYTLFQLGQMFSPTTEGTSQDRLMQAESKLILELASEEKPCIFVGRAAYSVLAHRNDVLSVFVYGTLEDRKKRAKENYGIEEGKVEDTLRRFDRRRREYYKNYSDLTWDDPQNYHLMLNSSRLGLDGCVQAIMQLM